MTAEQCYKLAQEAFNEMVNHPDIWLTHGYPRHDKEELIVQIIANKINEACRIDEGAAS